MRLLIGAALVFALFQWVATALGSDRGQAGLLVGAIVVSATLAAECLLFGTGLARAVRRLGLGVLEEKTPDLLTSCLRSLLIFCARTA